MMHSLRFLVSIVAGIVAHQTNPIFEDLEDAALVGAPWYRMARYGVGYLVALPTLLLMFPARLRRVVAEKYLSNGVLFGFGVAVGYVLDKWIREEKEHEIRHLEK